MKKHKFWAWAAVICVSDPVREEAADVITMLREQGFTKLVMMTGDSERTAVSVVRKIGVDEYYSEVLLEDKATFVDKEHACGHDFHTTFMLGAAKILKELSKQLEGTVKIIFQEGEEIGKGAFDILQTDLLDDVETIVGLHMDMNAPLGKFSVGYGVMSSYSGSVDIEISGGSHENPVQIASAVIQAVTQRSLMNFEGKEQVVLVPTVVKTISEKESKKVILTYNFRTLHPKNIEIMKQIMTEIPKKVAAISGGNVKTKIQTHTNVVNNDIEATNRAIRVIEQTFGKDAVVMAKPFMGGEDFSRYQKQIPGVFLHLGGVSDGNYGVLHTEKTNFDEKALCIGVEYLLNYIDEFFKERKCT